MAGPAFDTFGYPNEATLRTIRAWPWSDKAGFWEYVNEAWNHSCGKIRLSPTRMKFVTGGWSGNESIIRAVNENIQIGKQAWLSSHRGGLHVYEIERPKAKKRKGKA